MKKVWTSKTFWVNLIAIFALVAQGIAGEDVLPVEAQASLLAVVNLALRLVTKEPVGWK